MSERPKTMGTANMNAEIKCVRFKDNMATQMDFMLVHFDGDRSHIAADAGFGMEYIMFVPMVPGESVASYDPRKMPGPRSPISRGSRTYEFLTAIHDGLISWSELEHDGVYEYEKMEHFGE